MQKLILILSFILITTVFSKTSDEFLNEFKISERSAEYYNAGLNMESMNGDIKEIKKIYEQAVKEDGRNYLALNKLGYITRMEGKSREAEWFYQKSMEINPDAYETYDLIIALYRSNKENIKLKEFVEKLIDRHTEYPEGYYILGQVYESNGDNDNMLKYYTLALEKYKNYDIKKFPEIESIILENRKLDSIIGIANAYSNKKEFIKALDKLLVINPVSSNYSDIERQNYTNIVIKSLKGLNKINIKTSKKYLKIFQNRNIVSKNFKI